MKDHYLVVFEVPINGKEISKLSDRFISIRGVKHGKLE
ncbi:MAG: hypothetical protein WCU00_12185 [Candidatus Latescibacterota bacterium]